MTVEYLRLFIALMIFGLFSLLVNLKSTADPVLRFVSYSLLLATFVVAAAMLFTSVLSIY